MNLLSVFRKSFLFLAFFLFLLSLAIVIKISGMNSQIEKATAQIKADGFPISGAELDRWYHRPPDDQNAASFIMDALGVYVSAAPNSTHLPVVHRSAELPSLGTPVPDLQLKAIKKFLETNRESLELLKKTRHLTLSRYPINLSQGLNGLLPHLSPVKGGAQLLYLSSIYHTETDQLNEAVEAAVLSMGLAGSLAQEPLLISQLVRIAIQSITGGSIERMVNRKHFSDAQLASLQEAIRGGEDPEANVRAFAGERAFALNFFLNPGNLMAMAGGGMPTGAVAKVLSSLYGASGLRQTDALFYMDHMKKMIDIYRMPYPERLTANAKLKQTLTEMKKHPFKKFQYVISGQLLPAYGRAVEKDLRITATLRTIDTGLAILRFQAASNGKLPDTLADLTPKFSPQIPEDPYDGKPLRYLPRNDGFMVYSLGPNEKDDGGRTYKDARKQGKNKQDQEQYDVTFKVLKTL